MRGIVVGWAHLIVDAGFGELGGIFALIPGLYQGLGVLWNGQVQAVHAWLVMLVVTAARTFACSLGFVYRSVQVPKVKRGELGRDRIFVVRHCLHTLRWLQR